MAKEDKNNQDKLNQPNKDILPTDDSKETISTNTYFRYGTVESGMVEIDLVTFRERGDETRYLSFKFSGKDVRQEPPVPQDAFLNIENEEDFKKLKQFFSDLNWRD